MAIENKGLPHGWCWSAFQDLLLESQNGLSKRKGTKGEFVNVLRLADVKQNQISGNEPRQIQLTQKEIEKYKLSRNDLICIRVNGSKNLVGRVILFDEESQWAFCDHFIRFKIPLDNLDPNFATYCFESRTARNYIKENMVSSAGQNTVSQSTIGGLPVPVPPLNEQKRIVAKIEALQTHSTRVREALEAVGPLLEKFRQSVLASAFRGDLTREWRQQNPDVEPAEVLLARIREERRIRWIEEQAEKGRARAEARAAKAGKAWTEADDEKVLAKELVKAEKKYTEPEPLDASSLPDLPRGWCWAKVGFLGSVSGGLTKNSKRSSHGDTLPYLRVANVYANELRLDEIKEIGVTESELARVLLHKDDLLIVEGNGSLEQIGRVALWDGSISPCVHQNHLIKVRFQQPELARTILHWLLSYGGRQQIMEVASSSAGLHTLSLSKVSALMAPVPPLEEQAELHQKIRSLLSFSTEIVGTLLEELKRLNQSILAKAFRGELVPQDPDDEPASVLLERIKAEREAAAPKKKKKSTRKKPTKARPKG